MVLLTGLFCTVATANPPPAPVQEIEIVPSVVEGKVRFVFPGRDGDLLSIDGWNAGPLPLETEIAGGIHTFRVAGPSGFVKRDLNVEVVPGEVVLVDLAPPPAPPAPPAPVNPPPSPAPAP